MITQEYIKKFNAIPSTKYIDRYDVYNSIDVVLNNQNLTEIPIPFGVTGYFNCSSNQLTSLYNTPIEVDNDFLCDYNKLTTLDHLPKYIGYQLFCQNNPLQNLNALKDVTIKGFIWFSHKKEEQFNYWIKALYNTDLDALEWHYDNHTYGFLFKGLERYVMNELEEIIKVKRLKRDLNV